MDIAEFEARKGNLAKSPPAADPLPAALRLFKRRIAVWSGKGGVGKTTFAINLAYALNEKTPTGLVDADIDCPNVPAALGVQEQHVARDGKISPLEVEGLSFVSMGAIIGREALLWRGPMISAAITEFVHKVNWGQAEQLVFDMPPGSSDAAITLAQMIRPTGLVILTTSDELGMADARRSLQFARKLRLPVYGVVENMSGEVFGHGGGEKLASEFDVPYAGSLPLDRKIRLYLQDHRPLHKTEFGEVFRETAATIGKT